MASATASQSAETDRKGTPGRPQEDEMILAKRAVVRARNQLEEYEREMEAALGLAPDEEDTPRGRGVRRVADDRMERAVELERAKSRVREARQEMKQLERQAVKSTGQMEALKRALEEAKEGERRAQDRFNELPALGTTYEEWEEMSEEERKGLPGRPPLPVEVKIHRAENELEAALAELNRIESERGLAMSEAEDIDDAEARSASSGRPRLDTLGMLDRQVKQLEQRRREIEAEPETKPKLSKNNRPIGRRPKSKAEKLAEVDADLEHTRKLIAQAEAELDERGRVERNLKLLRDEARDLRREIRDDQLSETSLAAQRLRLVEGMIEARTRQLEDFDRLEERKRRRRKKSLGRRALTPQEIRERQARLEQKLTESEESHRALIEREQKSGPHAATPRQLIRRIEKLSG